MDKVKSLENDTNFVAEDCVIVKLNDGELYSGIITGQKEYGIYEANGYKVWYVNKSSIRGIANELEKIMYGFYAEAE